MAGHVVRVGAVLNACKILDVKPRGKVVLEYVGMNGSVVLICAFNKRSVRIGTGLVWIRTRYGEDCCEHCNEPLGSIPWPADLLLRSQEGLSSVKLICTCSVTYRTFLCAALLTFGTYIQM